MIEVAVVGVGGWGKNLARNYYQVPEANLRYICDLDDKKLGEAMGRQYPGTRLTKSFDDLLNDRSVGRDRDRDHGAGTLSAGQAGTRGRQGCLRREAVRAGSRSGPRVKIELPSRTSASWMVGHLLEYHPVITRLKTMIDDDELGDVYYVYSQRLNLGTVREDENALWNFAPHDISAILYLLGKEPVDVSARGQDYLQRDVEDIVFLTLSFADKTMAHIHVSWWIRTRSDA